MIIHIQAEYMHNIIVWLGDAERALLHGMI